MFAESCAGGGGRKACSVPANLPGDELVERLAKRARALGKVRLAGGGSHREGHAMAPELIAAYERRAVLCLLPIYGLVARVCAPPDM